MTAPATKVTPPPGQRRWTALCLLLAMVMTAWPAFGQNAAAPVATAAAAQGTKATSATDWGALSASQQSALKPLAPIWNDIGPSRKRKWVVMSENFSKLSPAEQATLHGRMGEWASLSPVARNRARLNFAETRDLPSQEKKAQWEAYQALSPAQKQQLAAQARVNRVSGAAPAVLHRAPGKLAAVPVTRSEPGSPPGASHRGQSPLSAAPSSGAAPSNP